MSEPTFICTRCHGEAPMSERREFDARDYCPRCLDAITAICHICGTRFPNNGVWEPMESGEMLKIDGAGVVTRSRFEDSKLLGWYPCVSTPSYRSDGTYIGELKAVAYAFGYTPAMIDRLISRGFQPEEIEEMLYQM